MRFSTLPVILLLSTASTILAAPHPLQPAVSELASLDKFDNLLATRSANLILPPTSGNHAIFEDDDSKTSANFIKKIFDKVKNIFKPKPKPAPFDPNPGNRINTPPGVRPLRESWSS
jgi:hypothetical protein